MRLLPFFIGVAGIPLIPSFAKAVCRYQFLCCAASQGLGPFMCQPRCQKSPSAVIHLPCKTAVWLQESWIIKEKTRWLSLRAQQGIAPPRGPKHRTWWRGVGDGSFRRKERLWIWKSLSYDSRPSQVQGGTFLLDFGKTSVSSPRLLVSKHHSKEVGNLFMTFWQLLIEFSKRRQRCQRFLLSFQRGNVTLALFINKIILRRSLGSACNRLFFNMKDGVPCSPLLGRM